MSCLVVIPAFSGSGDLSDDVLRPIAGQPLIGSASTVAGAAHHASRVVIGTDAPRIAEVARELGLEVVLCPEQPPTRTRLSEHAALHCLDILEARESYVPELVVLVHCTTPLTKPQTIDATIESVLAGADSSFSAVAFDRLLWHADASGAVSPIDLGRDRAQRASSAQVVEDGAVYAMRTQQFVAARNRFCGRVVCHVVQTSAPAVANSADPQVAHQRAYEPAVAIRTDRLPPTIGALVLDFDGVLTDNTVLVTDQGHEAVVCSRSDGMGLALIKDAGIKRLILSKERNPVVARRAEKLGIECLHAVDDKPKALAAWLNQAGVPLANTVFVGNDINDVGCMTLVGCSACPNDAHPSARGIADIVLSARGGHGAVRELCDVILRRRDKR